MIRFFCDYENLLKIIISFLEYFESSNDGVSERKMQKHSRKVKQNV